MRTPGLFILALLLLASFSSADSPPPRPTQVTLHLEKNGVAETGIQQVTYLCAGPSAGGESPAGEAERQIIFNCTQGTCTNEPWLGRNSMCEYFSAGHFSYYYEGRNLSSEDFNNTAIAREYELTLDVVSGKITRLASPNPDTICPSIFIIFLLLAGRFFSRRK